MIKELCLENWKSFKDSRLYIDPLTILIGTNASGKSNVLDALLFLQKLSQGKQITSAINGDHSSPGIRGGTEWIINRNSSKAKLEVVIESLVDKNIDYKYAISIGIVEDNRVELLSESLVRIKKMSKSNKTNEKNLFYTSGEDLNDPSITVYFATNTQGRGKRIDLRRSFSILSQSKSLALQKDVQEGISLVLNDLKSIFILDPIPSHMRIYSTFSETLKNDASNISGVLAALDKEKKEYVETVLTEYVKKLAEKDIKKVWTEPVGRFNSDAMIYCTEVWHGDKDEFTVDARGMSDGTLRFLAVMTALLTMEENSLLVIEEIDNGLHPSRADLLVKFLKEIGAARKIDVICTTHNPALLDAFGNEMIAFISVVYRDPSSGYSSIKLLEDIEELPKLIARGTVGKLTSLGVIENALN